MLKKQLYFLLMPLFLLMACSRKKEIKDTTEQRAEMIAAEISFSEMSKVKGTRAAMMQFIDSNGVLLRPNSFPLIGGDAINFISQSNDSAYTMIWQPKGGNIAASGDLGYTFGVYSVLPKNGDSAMHGTYVNVWKKLADGSWKLMLDSGNEGIEDEK
jgi:ketosteroid isomerase-like protein